MRNERAFHRLAALACHMQGAWTSKMSQTGPAKPRAITQAQEALQLWGIEQATARDGETLPPPSAWKAPWMGKSTKHLGFES